MAITLTSQLTDELLDPGSPSDFGTSNATKSETDIHLQGSNCAAAGHSGTVGTASPVTADSTASGSDFRGMYEAVSIVRDHNHVHFWIRDLYPIRDKSIGGVSVYLANGTSQECLYYMTGLDDGYLGDWFHGVVNLSTTDRAAADLGTLPGGDVNRLGYAGNISVSKGESFLQNSYLDAIRHGADGVGISFYGGTSGSREDMEACALADTASYGLLRLKSGALFCDGCLTFGVATQTHWLQDSLKTINFTGFTAGDGTTSVVATDYYRIVLADATTGVTNVDLTDFIWKGFSRAIPFRFTSNLGTGDAYTSLRSTYIFGETITLNSLCTSDSDSFIECQTIVPGGITLTDAKFTNCDAVTLTAANDEIDGGSTALHNTAVNIPFVTTDDPEKVFDHTFDNTGGTGHAIEITSSTGSPFSFVGNTFTGYGGTVGSNLTPASGNTSAAIFNDSGAAITINITGGGGNFSVRNGTSATTTVNLSESVSFEAVDSTDTGIEDVLITAYLVSDDTEVINARTLSTGFATTTFSGTTPADIYYRYRKASGGVTYKNLSGFATISAGTGVTVKRNMVVNPINDSHTDATVEFYAELTDRLNESGSVLPTLTRASSGTYRHGGSNTLITAGTNGTRHERAGVLLEESRENGLRQSEDFSTTWNLVAAAINTNVTTGPDGASTADRLIDDNLGGTSSIQVTQNLTVTAGNNCLSCFCKADQLDWCALRHSNYDNAGTSYFNLSNGTLGTKHANHSAYGIEPWRDDWWRVWIRYNTTTDLAGVLRVYVAQGDADTTLDRDGTSSIFVFGGQNELGDFPTSYIATTTAAVTRSADFLSYDDDTVIIDSAGSLYMEATPLFDSADSNNAVLMNVTDALVGPAYVLDSTTQQVSIGDGTTVNSRDPTFVRGTEVKLATRWSTAADEIQAIADGVATAAGVYDDAFTRTAGTLYIGSDSTGNHFNGNIKNVRIYNVDRGESQLIIDTS